jgi:type 1 fimbria pilin
MKDGTMTDISSAFIAGRMLQPLRCLVALLLVCVGLGATSSYAQITCTNGSVTGVVTPPANIKFKTGPAISASQLATMSTTLTLSGCTQKFPEQVAIGVEFPKVFASGTGGYVSRVTPFSVQASVTLSCNVTNACKDSLGAAIPVQATNNANGIIYKPVVEFTGSNAQNSNCITARSGGTNFTDSFNTVIFTFDANACTSYTFRFTATFEQNAVFNPTNATLVSPLLSTGVVGPYRLRFFTNTMIPSTLGASGVIRLDGGTSSSFVASTGTCSLTLPNSTINMTEISQGKLSALKEGDVVSSQNFTLVINNCAGTAAGAKKTFLWTFTTPKAGNLTRMENAVANGATGMSAQIEADSKISTVDGSALPSVITSGETYIVSGNNSDDQTLTYKARLIRNADKVTGGAFSSTATVQMNYQ